MKLDFDKTNWMPVKLGDVVVKKEENDRENAQKRFDRFLKVEHMDAGSLHIKRWSSQEGGDEINPTFYKIFRKGQILFPTRNPHLRRTALASFDGICGEKTLTLEANEEMILPEFLPFLFHSESFYAHTTSSIVGSTNPHCRWRDVANYEFFLPPKEQQAQLAELLWSIDKSTQCDVNNVKAIESSFKVRLNNYMIHGIFNSAGKTVKTKAGLLDNRLTVVKLKDCLAEKPAYGANAPSKSFEEGSPRYIRITDIDEDGLLLDDEIVSIDADKYNSYLLKDNDFLFARSGNTVGKTYLHRPTSGIAVYAGYLIRFRLNQEKLRPKFLFYFTKSLKFDSFKKKMMKVGAQPNINSEEYQSMYIPKLSIDEQDEVVAKLDNHWDIITVARNKLKSSKELQMSLINKVF
ncbi:restriction endonuclease subunit S [Vibrio tubiashii]|uniref:restriction endonuclease subunit S n=1 Tax=Vibrio tubiashii TaxID=29498 RepID=UPI003CE585AD